jgi:hypothetical protein
MWYLPNATKKVLAAVSWNWNRKSQLFAITEPDSDPDPTETGKQK